MGSTRGAHRLRPANIGFRPDIEGLRAVAVLAVVLFHAHVPGVGGGYIGVDVFFVISGFLITRLLWQEVSTSGTVRLRRFYGARARRLLPASATVGIVIAVASALLLPPLQAKSVMVDAVASALYVGNYQFLLQGVDYLAANLPVSPFQHYWSLSVEEQFYFVWPALMILAAWLVRRARRRKAAVEAPSARPYIALLAVVAIASFALCWAVSHLLPAVAFFSLPTRAWQLALGGLVALTAGRWSALPPVVASLLGWTGLAVVVFACTALSTSTLYPGTAALLPTLGAALVIGAGCAVPTQGCGRVLASSPMRVIGRLSYSWYLWHWPVLLLAPLLTGRPLGLSGTVAAVLVSAGLAVLTLVTIENPIRYSTRLRGSPGGSLALGGAATATAVGVAIALLMVIPAPVGSGAPVGALTVQVTPLAPDDTPDGHEAAVRAVFAQVQGAVSEAVERKDVPSNLDPPLAEAAAEGRDIYLDGCMRTFLEAGQPDCVWGDPASTTTVALVGDSNAVMWAPAFQRLAEQRRWRLTVMGKASCPLMTLPISATYLQRVYTVCEQWREHVIGRLNAERPQLVVVGMWRRYGAVHEYGGGHGWLSAYESYSPQWIEGLGDLVRQVHGMGSKVLVLGPIPDPRTLVPTCLSGHLDDATACAPATSAAVNQSGIARESASTQINGGDYADLTELFCTESRCPVIVGNTLVYFDATHVTAEYAGSLAPVMGALADRALAGS
ncbi:acyltransferase family protein [Mycolicibacterium arseniciresistens]|uniref:Acyltransferase family protein n=1 Tax=Mycolicibacterium arseniciresistens TaxID=3062257 RepID=A0ABT8UD47_9MYCO|nr:acyltransferase family protein [Mycolicibacterium arseniciresistens]MDO3635720.1 acyltransferase family protein [Mycolicibacterium arseniciresistens]